MKLKSFFANTIEDAIRLARSELGPDAMLINSKRTDAEAQHLGFYEVVVCGTRLETGVPPSTPKQAAKVRRQALMEARSTYAARRFNNPRNAVITNGLAKRTSTNPATTPPTPEPAASSR